MGVSSFAGVSILILLAPMQGKGVWVCLNCTKCQIYIKLASSMEYSSFTRRCYWSVLWNSQEGSRQENRLSCPSHERGCQWDISHQNFYMGDPIY
jgi:hypothetical protein